MILVHQSFLTINLEIEMAVLLLECHVMLGVIYHFGNYTDIFMN